MDIEEVRAEILDFAEGNRNRVTFYLPSVHCAACIWLLEKLNRLHDGVYRSEINYLRKELTVHFDAEQLSLKQLVELLEDLGYPPDLQRKKGNTAQQKNDKELLVKLGLAGFVFGNIMLFSFPEYLSINEESLRGFSELFGWINLMLAIPVLVYCDRDYLVSAWKSLKLRYLTIDVPISLGIITLFGRSAYEIISGTGTGYFDSFAGLIFFLLVGKWFQSRTYSAIAFDRDFKSYFPMAVAKVEAGEESVVLIEKIKTGDRLRILNNQIIPADCMLSSGEAIVDYSFVSGESDSIRKGVGERLFAGGRQLGGIIEVDVVKEVSQSYLTQLWNQGGSTEQKASTDSDLINRTSQWFSVGIISIALLTLIGWLLIDPSQAMNSFTAVLIIACPCALALAMPFASGNVSRLLGRRGFFIRNAETLETMAKTEAFVFDKTGTLTDNNASKLRYFGPELNTKEEQIVFSIASASTHPLSVSIANWLKTEMIKVEGLKEKPGLGIEATVGLLNVKLGSAEFCGTNDLEQQGSQVHVCINGEYNGTYVIEKGLRKGVKEMVGSIENSELYLLSGDNNRDEARMRKLFGNKAQLHFNQSPQSKLEFIQALENGGKRTIMFGDGLNDAGALKVASTGIAVADNVYSFSPACDVILQASQLQNFGRILRYAKRSIQVVRASIIISLIYNVIGLFFAVQGDLTPIVAAILMPLSSITVVAFVTFITTITAPDLGE